MRRIRLVSKTREPAIRSIYIVIIQNWMLLNHQTGWRPWEYYVEKLYYIINVQRQVHSFHARRPRVHFFNRVNMDYDFLTFLY